MSGPERSPLSGQNRERWQVRVFRAWLRIVATRLDDGSEQDIVGLFTERLNHEGQTVVGRMRLLIEAMSDALFGDGTLGFAAPPPARPTTARRTVGETLLSTWRDVRFAARSLRRRPMFSGIAVVALGLGIGGATAMFTVVDGVLLKRLPYDDPASVVSVWKAWPSWQGQEGLDYTWDHIQFPWVDYINVRDNAGSFSTVAAHAQATMVLTGTGPSEELSVGEASGNLFSMLGVRLAVGRAFRPDETAPVGTPAPVVILSHQLWDRRFGADPGVIGSTIQLNNEPFEIIGVLPERFRLGSDLISTHDNSGGVDPGLRALWTPLGTEGTDRGNSFELIARLAPDRTIEQARAEVQALMTDGPEDQLARVEQRQAVVTRGFHAPLGTLLAAAALLMAIACTNVMGLLLGEAPARRREIAVRTALGASRARVLRQLVTENVLLGVVGSLLGIVCAWIGLDWLLAAGPALPNVEQVGIDWRVIAFAATAGMSTGVLFGVLPALDLSRSSVAEKLRSRSRGRRSRRLQSRVVSAQIALTMVLLVTAGLAGRSLSKLFAVEPGFDADGAHAFSIGAPPGGLASREAAAQYVEDVLAAAEAVPGVSSATLASRLPFASSNGTQGFSFLLDGEPQQSTQLPMVVHPTYFETTGIPLLEGRLLNRLDNDDNPRAMLVSRAWVDEYLDGASPVGLRVRYRSRDAYDWTIVGVVDDVRHQALGVEPLPTFYMTSLQQPRLDYMLMVRTETADADLFATLRAAILRVDPGLPVADAGALPSLVRASESDDRFRALLLGTFAGLAMALGVIGVFGVTARAVSARTREIGIRAALGAGARELRLLVVREGLVSAVLGIVVGLGTASIAARVLAPQLYETSPLDPVAFAGATAVALIVCVTAGYAPAHRATRIDPARVVAEE